MKEEKAIRWENDYGIMEYENLINGIKKIIQEAKDYDDYRDCPHYTVIEELEKLIN